MVPAAFLEKPVRPMVEGLVPTCDVDGEEVPLGWSQQYEAISKGSADVALVIELAACHKGKDMQKLIKLFKVQMKKAGARKCLKSPSIAFSFSVFPFSAPFSSHSSFLPFFKSYLNFAEDVQYALVTTAGKDSNISSFMTGDQAESQLSGLSFEGAKSADKGYSAVLAAAKELRYV